MQFHLMKLVFGGENNIQVQESLKSLIGLEKNILQMKGLQKKK